MGYVVPFQCELDQVMCNWFIMHWPSPARPPQFLLHSVWHQGASPLLPECVQLNQQYLVKKPFWVAWSIYSCFVPYRTTDDLQALGETSSRWRLSLCNLQKVFTSSLRICMVSSEEYGRRKKSPSHADVCQSYISEQFWPRFIILLGYQNCFSNFLLLPDSSEDTMHYWENFWTLLVDHIRNSISS